MRPLIIRTIPQALQALRAHANPRDPVNLFPYSTNSRPRSAAEALQQRKLAQAERQKLVDALALDQAKWNDIFAAEGTGLGKRIIFDNKHARVNIMREIAVDLLAGVRLENGWKLYLNLVREDPTGSDLVSKVVFSKDKRTASILICEARFKYCNTKEIMAWVLAHEIGHVVRGHYDNGFLEPFLRKLRIRVYKLLRKMQALTKTPKHRKQIFDRWETIDYKIERLRSWYHRPTAHAREFEADRFALLAMAKSGYDPAQGTEFLRMFKDQGYSEDTRKRQTAWHVGMRMAEICNKAQKTEQDFVMMRALRRAKMDAEMYGDSHPSDRARIQRMQELMPEAEAIYRSVVAVKRAKENVGFFSGPRTASYSRAK